MIYSARVVPYGSTKFALKLPVTSSSTQGGCLLMAVKKSSMSEALLGVMFHPTVCHRYHPVSI